MKGDLSRNTFDRALHYSAVRLQQGRIVTDADWNEQADLTRYRAERQARDTIGACGAPMDAAGYALVAGTNALAVHAVNANVAWIAAEDGALLATSDGGATWSLVDLQTSAHLRAIQQAGGDGWAVGDGGLVRRTTNQGASWTPQDAGTLNALHGVAVFDADHAWAVGDGGIVVATSDGGATWSLVQTGAPRLYAVHFSDEFTGLAVGQGGAIVATTRRRRDLGCGGEWHAATTCARSRASARRAHGLPAPAARSCAAPTPARPGCRATRRSTATLYAIAFRDALEGWAAGEGGTLLHTTDGGANWTLEGAGTAATLRGLSFFGSEPGWLVGDASTALRVGGGSPDVADLVLPAVNLSIEAGRCYVDGILCELEARASYAHQPDGGAGERLAPGSYLLYLDAWQRHVSALEAPAIREVALGGVDTATRARTVAQVRALAAAGSQSVRLELRLDHRRLGRARQRDRPRLAARAEPQLAAANLCEIAATAGYRRLENQLYRVEVHDGGANPTFKWSRENGSVAYAVVSISVDTALQQTTVRLAARGRDANLDLAVHDRVELLDDDAELIAARRDLLRVPQRRQRRTGAGSGRRARRARSGRTRRAIRSCGAGTTSPRSSARTCCPSSRAPGSSSRTACRCASTAAARTGRATTGRSRRARSRPTWNGRATTTATRSRSRRPASPMPIAGSASSRWVATARSPWSATAASSFRRSPRWSSCCTCRATARTPRRTRCCRSRSRCAWRAAACQSPGVGIRFEVESGGGRVSAGGLQFETTTDADGQALCDWTLGPGAAAPGRFQRVRASLLDADGQPVPGQWLVYCATATLDARTTLAATASRLRPAATLPNPLEFRVDERRRRHRRRGAAARPSSRAAARWSARRA